MTRDYPNPGRTRLAVLGSPISHSRSPALHQAAYRVLDLDWTYEAIEVAAAGLADFLQNLDDGWRGLSLTMPLKRDVLDLPLGSIHPLAVETRSANTILLSDRDSWHAENTDVFGIVQALRDSGPPSTVLILGAGATAASSVVAAAELGAHSVHVGARSPHAAARLALLGGRHGLAVSTGGFDAPVPFAPDLVISTLPGGAVSGAVFSDAVVAGATLLDVAYDPWPSELAARWSSGGGRVVHGLEMLVEQAVGQIRIFLGGDAGVPLPDEVEVRAAMRRAAGPSLR